MAEFRFACRCNGKPRTQRPIDHKYMPTPYPSGLNGQTFPPEHGRDCCVVHDMSNHKGKLNLYIKQKLNKDCRNIRGLPEKTGRAYILSCGQLVSAPCMACWWCTSRKQQLLSVPLVSVHRLHLHWGVNSYQGRVFAEFSVHRLGYLFTH